MKRLFAFLLLACAAFATSVIPMETRELAARAPVIVRARAVSSTSAWEGGFIYTRTTFAVTRSYKGSAPQTITVRRVGGSAGGYTQRVAGVRPFRTGTDAVLFLHPSDARDGTYAVVGLMQGDYRVTKAADGSSWVSNGVPQPSRGASRKSLSDLEREIVSAGGH